MLIDGNNVLHAIGAFAPRGRDRRPFQAAFERWLAARARAHAVEACVVVWDGARPATSRPVDGVRVEYSGPRSNADDRLIELCRGEFSGQAPRSWLVSSDRELRTRARRTGFTVLGAMTFYRRWSRAPNDEAPDPR